MRIRQLVALATVGLAGLLVGGCEPLDGPGEAPFGAASPTVDVPAGHDPDGSTAALDGLAVVSWASMSGYSRNRFDHWNSQGNGCDTRDVVLQRDGQDVRVGANCSVTGTWFSPYDGKTITEAQGIDIDHMVPLANAWRTGAAGWTDERREEFANDLTRPQLLAVSASSNRSKGDQDPSQWKPPRAEYWCTYAQQWIAVKSYWQLGVTTAEKTALTEMLGTCP